MKKESISIQLQRINTKLTALETALYTVSNDLKSFIEDDTDNTDLVLYGQVSILGVAEFLEDIKQDIILLNVQIDETNDFNFKLN